MEESDWILQAPPSDEPEALLTTPPRLHLSEAAPTFTETTPVRPHAHGRSTVRRLTIALMSVGLVLAVAVSLAVTQWRRAVDGEAALAQARKQVSGLNSQVEDLNDQIDTVSSRLSQAQDDAAVSGAERNAFAAATLELSYADDLMHGAIDNIGLLISAIADGNIALADTYANRIRNQLDQAQEHESNAKSALG